MALSSVIAGCGAPQIADDIDYGDLPLPDRVPAADGGDGGTRSDIDSGRAPQNVDLTITLTGGGTGAITSTPSGVTCTGTTCKGSFARGTAVMLAAAPGTGSLFGGWSGGCTGPAGCAVKLDANVSAAADFQSLAGAWSGMYTNSRVASGCQFNNAGNLNVTITASGTAFSNTANVTGLEIRQIPGCALVNKVTGAAPDAPVTIAGDTLTGTWAVNVQGTGTLPFPFTAKVAGKTITGSWTCTGCTGNFTLTKP
jgi:hypothetical protein